MWNLLFSYFLRRVQYRDPQKANTDQISGPLIPDSVFGWDRFGFSKDISPFYFKLRDQYHRLFNGMDDPRNKSRSFRPRNHENRLGPRKINEILIMTKAIGTDWKEILECNFFSYCSKSFAITNWFQFGLQLILNKINTCILSLCVWRIKWKFFPTGFRFFDW